MDVFASCDVTQTTTDKVIDAQSTCDGQTDRQTDTTAQVQNVHEVAALGLLFGSTSSSWYSGSSDNIAQTH